MFSDWLYELRMKLGEIRFAFWDRKIRNDGRLGLHDRLWREYSDEAEHGDGSAYWLNFKSFDDMWADYMFYVGTADYIAASQAQKSREEPLDQIGVHLYVATTRTDYKQYLSDCAHALENMDNGVTDYLSGNIEDPKEGDILAQDGEGCLP
jgi:hypothetical protein